MRREPRTDAGRDWWCPAVLLACLGALVGLGVVLVRVYP
jgi:hypothetical protein